MRTLCQVRVVFDRCENMPDVVCVMVHTVALGTASLERSDKPEPSYIIWQSLYFNGGTFAPGPVLHAQSSAFILREIKSPYMST